MNRRQCTLGGLAAALPLLGGGLGGCGTPAPPLRWYRLPTELPAGQTPPSPDPGVGVWALSPKLPMPELLERDTLLVEEGGAGIRLLQGHRWAEPLRDALPRLLRHDLALWLPGLWPSPVSPGVALTGLVQAELLALQGNLTTQQVRVAARWVITPGNAAPAGAAQRAMQADLSVPWADAGVGSLVLAQRAAMWRLAARIAASLERP